MLQVTCAALRCVYIMYVWGCALMASVCMAVSTISTSGTMGIYKEAAPTKAAATEPAQSMKSVPCDGFFTEKDKNDEFKMSQMKSVIKVPARDLYLKGWVRRRCGLFVGLWLVL